MTYECSSQVFQQENHKAIAVCFFGYTDFEMMGEHTAEKRY